MKKFTVIAVVILLVVATMSLCGCSELIDALSDLQEQAQEFTKPNITAPQPDVEQQYESSSGVVNALASTVMVQATTLTGGLSSGAGVIYQQDTEGYLYIITNYHVVADANTTFNSYTVFPYGAVLGATCELVAGSEANDIAVLRTDAELIINKNSIAKCATLNTNAVAVGMQALAVGNPLGSGLSVSQGIISVDRENIDVDAGDDGVETPISVIRTDAPVNHGNSGGGLYDIDGNLIGIVNAKSGEEDVEGMGYAIPLCNATAIADKIIATGTNATKYMLGVTTVVGNSSSYIDADGNLQLLEAVVVKTVVAGSIAQSAGFKVNDVLLSLSLDGDERAITRSYMLADLLLSYNGCGTLVAVVERNGAEVTLTIDLSTCTPTIII